MTEPNEEDLEPLVIEPRPEILQATPGGQTREENKPTTICLICGHVLFKKVKVASFLSKMLVSMTYYVIDTRNLLRLWYTINTLD